MHFRPNILSGGTRELNMAHGRRLMIDMRLKHLSLQPLLNHKEWDLL